MAFPGIRSAYTVGLAPRTGSTDKTDVGPRSSTTGATLAAVPAGRGVDVPLADAYSLRVNLSRRLYDRGSAMLASPALVGLIGATTVGLNHFDLDRLGVTTGDVVSVTGAHGDVSLPVVLNDGVPRGCIDIAFNTLDANGENALAQLFDATNVITQVRVETL
jgi:predicted molibdopterin-dependent oxidoreductase YjgC